MRIVHPGRILKMKNAKKRIHQIQSKITDLRLKIQALSADKKKNQDKIAQIEAKINQLLISA